jgi:hypothetical protein
MVNDLELYPRSPNTPASSAFYALGAQLLPDHKNGKHKDGKHKLPGHRKQHKPVVQPLGYVLGAASMAKSTEDDMELVQVDLQITEVGNVFIDGIPTIEIKVVKTPEGGLLIGSVETMASASPSKDLDGNPEECAGGERCSRHRWVASVLTSAVVDIVLVMQLVTLRVPTDILTLGRSSNTVTASPIFSETLLRISSCPLLSVSLLALLPA